MPNAVLFDEYLKLYPDALVILTEHWSRS